MLNNRQVTLLRKEKENEKKYVMGNYEVHSTWGNINAEGGIWVDIKDLFVKKKVS